MSFDEALARTRRAYAIGLSGGRTAAGTPHEEASEAKGLWDRMRAREPKPGKILRLARTSKND